jgi:antitoxin PrlF
LTILPPFSQYLNILKNQIKPKKEEKMAKEKKSSCCGSGKSIGSCCRVESVVSVDERGQMILPKEVRERAGIRPGDKLAVVTWGGGKDVCCISLIKADEFARMVKTVLGPMMKEISSKE